MGSTPRHVLEKIREAKEKQLGELDLGNDWDTENDQKLTEIPPEVFELGQLEVLKLSHNLLTSVPDSITQLQNLTTLNLNGNNLTEIPDSITKLKSLTTLDLSENNLTEIPDSITKLENLTTLDLSDTRLTEIPDFIIELKSLTTLDLSENNLTEIPDSITKLENLTTLNLGNTGLTEIPDSITKLKSLASLNLSHNKLTEFPDSITKLQTLTMLSLIGNKLTDVPYSVVRLKNLTELRLSNNPIKIPSHLVLSGEAEGIKGYLRQLEAEGEEYLYEAKLIILGEAGTGKTTLAKKIQNQGYRLRKREPATKGIDVTRCRFSGEKEETFWINIWDFGTQEVYYSTHQFFFTKRSLYILIVDDADTDFYHWLSMVELWSDNSPLLIIKNEKRDLRQEIEERQLYSEFINLKEILATNLKTNRGLNEVMRQIKFLVQSLPHIGDALPKTWVRVREMLEKDKRNYISQHEYLDICEQNGIIENSDKLQLSSYLHDLGICLHFQDDPVLRQTVILQLEWGTAAVYKVLANKAVIWNLGRFTWSDLEGIWNESQYANMHHGLLQLMLNFKLCYQIPGSDDTYIAPQLLTENQPAYDWDEADNLFLRYRYEFMPKGIVARFIVAIHQLIVDQEYAWRSGVVLQKDETRAEVMEYYYRREIRIRIVGRHKRDLMMEVIHELDRIHDLYNRLRCDKLIPCNCGKCGGSQEPHFYEFEILREFMADGYDIQCQKSRKLVDPRGLMDDVIDRERFSKEERPKDGDSTIKIKISLDTLNDINGVIESLKQSINKLDIHDSEKSDLKAQVNTIQAQVNTIDAQISSPNPNRTILIQSLCSIKNILEEAAGSLIATTLPEILPHLAVLLDRLI